MTKHKDTIPPPQHPCDICGDRVMVYPGACDTCRIGRRRKFKDEWESSYKSNTARHESRRWQDDERSDTDG